MFDQRAQALQFEVIVSARCLGQYISCTLQTTTYLDLAKIRINCCLKLGDTETLKKFYDTITRRELRGLVSVMFMELIEYMVKAIVKN